MAHFKLELNRTGITIRLLKCLDISKLEESGIREQFILPVCNHFVALEDYTEKELNMEDENNTKV